MDVLKEDMQWICVTELVWCDEVESDDHLYSQGEMEQLLTYFVSSVLPQM